MQLHELTPADGSRKNKKRVGRGTGSGMGKTSTRGHKGQNSRSGGGVRPGFEGGQMPIARRLPKRGFTNIFAKEYAIVNLDTLNKFEDGAKVDIDILLNAGIVKNKKCGLKVLGDGVITKKLDIVATKASKSATEKIQAAGGKIEVIQ